MKKEVFLAIAIGFVLGLIITFGVWTANNSLKQLSHAPSPTPLSSPEPQAQAATPTPPPATNNLQLTVSAPDPDLLTNSQSLTVKGSTSPNATVAILSESAETTVTADSSGNFSADVSLEGGYNRLTVSAFDKDSHTASLTLVVTYTTSKI